MPDERKHVLAKRDYMAGMKYKDIADKYNVSLATVKSWKTREKWPNRNKKSMHTKKEKVCIQNKNKDAEKKQAIAEEVESVIDNPDLTDKQRLFCLYYSRSFNATSSYLKAYGCTYDVANAEGYKLLVNPCVREEIKQLKKGRMARELLSEDDIFEKYMQIAFADITDYVDFGNEDIEVTTKSGDTKEITVNYVNIRNSDQVDGTLLSEVSQGREGVKVKLPDRMKALDWLAAHMDMATEVQKAQIEHIRAQTQRVIGGDQTTTEDKVAKLFTAIGGVLDDVEP